MRESLKDYCLRCGFPELLSQWNSEKNGDLTPDMVSSGSKKKVWWRCENGHEWQSVVHTRSKSHAGCPYCSNHQVYPGKDLASRFPDIALQWHPLKNGDFRPDQVSPNSHKEVWWICEKGHEWRALVKTRVFGCGCPVCANRVTISGENDLATTDPFLAAQWHPTKNQALLPSQVVRGSSRRVWWICEKGHEWQASINSRVSGSGCPVCAGKKIIPGVNDLASCYPQLAAQWCQERNGMLHPDQVSSFSNKQVWWQCEKGHVWMAGIGNRLNSGSNCPYCTGRLVLKGFNDLQTKEPLIAAQWHPTLNGCLTPDMVTVHSHKKVWWICGEGHVWQAVIYSRTSVKKCGCPVCAGKVKVYDTRKFER